MLRQVDALAGDQDLFLVRLGAWFHDAVYDIPCRELTNEEASARLALRELSRAGLEQEDLTQVARLVRLTADHMPGSRDPEGDLLCDADLAVLAGTPEEYAAYVAGGPRGVRRGAGRGVLGGALRGARAVGRGRDLPHGRGKLLTPAARANVPPSSPGSRSCSGIEPPEAGAAEPARRPRREAGAWKADP